MASSTPSQHDQAPVTAPLPRITIQFCTQCKWMLRAAYYAQELLSTFSLSIGEVALQPSTGGTFIVTIHHLPSSSTNAPSSAEPSVQIQSTVLWDRKTDGGFPETKDLKRRVRDVIDPARHLGHVDRDHPRPSSTTAAADTSAPAAATQEAAPASASPIKEDAQQRDKEAQNRASSGIVCEDCA